ncbi:sporulation protein YlmC with PRC-barrel domain [Marmoricola sp. URHA0025 HA25]
MTETGAEDRRHTNRLEGPWLDAALHLMDRQVVDIDGMMVCNVDDLEITDGGGRELSVTGLLVGPAALVPRFSGRLGGWLREMWVSLGVQYAGRELPLRLGLDLVEHVGSDVRLRVGREGLLDRQSPAAPGVTLRRMDALLGMDVVLDGTSKGHVLDVRLEPRRRESRLVLRSLVVGRGRPGSLLGYDRGDVSGPWLVDAAVRWLHRHTVELGMGGVRSIDWERGLVEASRSPGPLEAR